MLLVLSTLLPPGSRAGGGRHPAVFPQSGRGLAELSLRPRDPQEDSCRKPLRNRQRIIVDDIVDTRLGSQRGDRIINVNDCHHTLGLNT